MCLNLLEITITTWSFCFIFLGIDRELLSVDLKQLEACTKQSREVPLTPLEFQNVGNITNCHLFASKKVIRSCYYFTSVACKKSSSSVSSTKGFLQLLLQFRLGITARRWPLLDYQCTFKEKKIQKSKV